MLKTTPMFEPMRKLCGRERKGDRAKLEGEKQKLLQAGLGGMNALIGGWIDPALLKPEQKGAGSRNRIFDVATSFQGFLWQILQGQTSCREVVREVQAVRAASGKPMPDSATGAYCQARARLPLQRINEVHQRLTERMENMVRREDLWLGRRVKILDGSGVRVEDTADNAAEFGYPTGQKPGCGFPVLKLAGIFSLSSGAWLGHRVGRTATHDLVLGRELVQHHVEPQDVVLGDRGFCAWWLLALVKTQNADAVFRLHQARLVDFRNGKRLGQEDMTQTWKKPERTARCPLSEAEYAALPDEITVRVVRMRLEKKGQRTQEIVLVSTLLDPAAVSRKELCALYARRWQIELNFDDLKTTLGMEHIACKSPQMVERALGIFSCAYNLIRALMLEAAVRADAPLWRLSFKGSGGALAQWLGLVRGKTSPKKALQLWESLLSIVAEDLIPLRPSRQEPRAVKRRPKNYRLLTQKRSKMKPAPHRTRYTKKSLI